MALGSRDFIKQPCTHCILWLPVVTHMQIYNGKDEAEQKKIRHVQFEKKMNSWKYNEVTASA